MKCPMTGFDCLTCEDGECEIEMRRMRALYEGEKRAGMLDPEQARQDIKDAGRGHLLKS